MRKHRASYRKQKQEELDQSGEREMEEQKVKKWETRERVLKHRDQGMKVGEKKNHTKRQEADHIWKVQ